MTDHIVYDIDGPPTAYFEIKREDDTFTRIVYRTLIARRAAEDVATRALADFIEKIKAELAIRHGTSIIWWRVRPSTAAYFSEGPHEAGSIGRARQEGFSARCRLETSPPLPEEWWDAHAIRTEARSFQV